MAATSFMKLLVITIFVVCVITFEHRSGECYSGFVQSTDSSYLDFLYQNTLAYFVFLLFHHGMKKTFAVVVLSYHS